MVSFWRALVQAGVCGYSEEKDLKKLIEDLWKQRDISAFVGTRADAKNVVNPAPIESGECHLCGKRDELFEVNFLWGQSKFRAEAKFLVCREDYFRIYAGMLYALSDLIFIGRANRQRWSWFILPEVLEWQGESDCTVWRRAFNNRNLWLEEKNNQNLPSFLEWIASEDEGEQLEKISWTLGVVVSFQNSRNMHAMAVSVETPYIKKLVDIGGKYKLGVFEDYRRVLKDFQRSYMSLRDSDWEVRHYVNDLVAVLSRSEPDLSTLVQVTKAISWEAVKNGSESRNTQILKDYIDFIIKYYAKILKVPKMNAIRGRIWKVYALGKVLRKLDDMEGSKRFHASIIASKVEDLANIVRYHVVKGLAAILSSRKNIDGEWEKALKQSARLLLEILSEKNRMDRFGRDLGNVIEKSFFWIGYAEGGEVGEVYETRTNPAAPLYKGMIFGEIIRMMPVMKRFLTRIVVTGKHQGILNFPDIVEVIYKSGYYHKNPLKLLAKLGNVTFDELNSRDFVAGIIAGILLGPPETCIKQVEKRGGVCSTIAECVGAVWAKGVLEGTADVSSVSIAKYFLDGEIKWDVIHRELKRGGRLRYYFDKYGFRTNLPTGDDKPHERLVSGFLKTLYGSGEV